MNEPFLPTLHQGESYTEALDAVLLTSEGREETRPWNPRRATSERGKKLAFSSNAYLRFSFTNAAHRIRRQGYRGIEIMADVPHAWPAYLLPRQIADIQRALLDSQLAISNINAFMMNAINDPRQRYWHPSWIEPDRH
ncbi:MAG: hypothetical protein L0219_06750, partial [Phycisphaerales bacterium]|nr:hypothetical protein [Phycisphaerales bacterium]